MLEKTPLTQDAFREALMHLSARYHIHHPFHKAMSAGQLSREQIQAWVANRYYYQITIPRKDAAILANAPDANFRRRWIQRIIDHDGSEDTLGGIEAWLRLAEAVGLERAEVMSLTRVLPSVKFAVDGYYNFACQAPWQEAVCSSLTELFAPEIHQQRLHTWPVHYPWVEPAGLGYFQKRLSEARRDVEHGLEVTLNHFKSYEQQQRAIDIVKFKLEVLWSLCDALHYAYPLKQETKV
jgi:pyrroloquinoline-quinone synthase